MNQIAAFASDPPPLVRYEAACRAIAEAKSVDEVKEVRAGAAAMLAYARQAKNKQLEIDASEIRFRAERRLGELIAAQRREVGLATGGQPYQATGAGTEPVERAPTLAAAGIDKKLSARAQRYAAIPEAEFRALLADRREQIERRNARVTNDLLGGKRLGAGDFEWYTPRQLIELARAAMGSIDLDPATSELAQETVRATRYFTIADDGSKQGWSGNVWLNPPYGRPGIRDFTDKLLAEWEAGHLTAAIVLTHAYTTAGWFVRLSDAATAVCFSKRRLKFTSPKGERVATGTMLGQAFFYFGPDRAAFVRAFGSVGTVMVPIAR